MTISAAAQDFPALYDVSGVTAGDTLNVRRAPDLSSQAFDALKSTATRIEVLEQQGKWMRINAGESIGWVAARYMTPNTDTDDPPSLACFGTEPFWDMTKTVTGPYRLRILDDYRMAFIETGPVNSRNDTRVQASLGAGNPGKLWVLQRKQICSDGMSDTSYGIAVDVLLDRDDGTQQQLYSGCCSLK